MSRSRKACSRILTIPQDGQAVFADLEKVYLYRYVFTKGLPAEDAGYPIVLIEDGAMKRENLRAAGVDEAWVTAELARRGCGSVREVYLLLRFGDGSVYFAEKQ